MVADHLDLFQQILEQGSPRGISGPGAVHDNAVHDNAVHDDAVHDNRRQDSMASGA
jgi:hypothetical protein